VFAVALFELATSIDAEAAALATDLGTTLYEERMHLAAGLPLIVRTSAEREPAADLLRKLRARGHGAVACDARAVVPAEQMIPMRTFALEDDAITLSDRPDERLPYDDILAMLRARHRTESRTRTEVSEKRLSLGRAVATGGLMLRKGVTREESTTSAAEEQILYVFRRSRETPWLLRERATSYAAALGADLVPSSAQNFLRTIDALRKRAPEARYDERLLQVRRIQTRSIRTGTKTSETLAVSTAPGIDLLAHLTALWLGRGASIERSIA
jgi:hypothetical protein